MKSYDKRSKWETHLDQLTLSIAAYGRTIWNFVLIQNKNRHINVLSPYGGKVCLDNVSKACYLSNLRRFTFRLRDH
jgi:hypothetical protein